MRDGFNYLDPDRPEAVRLSVGNARALGETALVRIGYFAATGSPAARILAVARDEDQGHPRPSLHRIHEPPVSAFVDTARMTRENPEQRTMRTSIGSHSLAS